MRPLIPIALVLVVLAAACGDDDARPTPTSTTITAAAGTTAAGTTAVATTAGPAEPEEEPVTTTTIVEEATEHTDDHDHEHDGVFEWDGGEIPVVTVTVGGDAQTGWTITADFTNFVLSQPSETQHVPGRGHTHVYVDGRVITMSYEPVVTVTDLEPGTHTATVALSNNAHIDYAVDGVVISGETIFEVAGAVSDADVVVDVRYTSGVIEGVDGRIEAKVGDTVEITVTSDVADELHVHGYDIFGDLVPGEAVVVRFVANIPGIFEVELEGARVDLLELRVG